MRKEKHLIKSGQAAAVHALLTGDYSGADAIEMRNKAIYIDCFKRLQYGLIDRFYVLSGRSLYLFTRSAKNAGAVQFTAFTRYGSGRDAEFIAGYDLQLAYVCDLWRKQAMPCGRLYVVGGWYDELFKKGVTA